MAVKADVDEKGKPSLQAQVQHSKTWVLDVEVQVQALAQFQVRLKHFGLVIASHFVGPARFYTAKDRYQALFNAIALSDFSRQVFLGQGAAAQIREWALKRLGQSLGTLADLVGQSRGKPLEVFAQHLGFAQILLKNLGAIQVAERTLKAQTVEGVKNAHDIFLVFLYKKVWDAVCWSRAFVFHETLLLHQPSSVSSSLNINIHSPILYFAASYADKSVAALPRWVLCVSVVNLFLFFSYFGCGFAALGLYGNSALTDVWNDWKF
jgi:hypothetical protein